MCAALGLSGHAVSGAQPPGPPVIGIATAQAGEAIVRFAPPDTGADGVTHYTVTASPGGATTEAPASPVVLRGLRNGTRYTFTVRAHGPGGAGPASAPSNPVTPAARTPTPLDLDVTWVLPSWDGLTSASPEAMAAMVQRLRREIGDGPAARVGLSVFVQLTMPRWDIAPGDTAAIRAALASAIAPVDDAIARARPHRLPIGISLITAIRERVDGVQTAAQAEDRRNVQWYHDQQLAGGWVTYSQYARKLRRIQEAYVREFGRMLAERMVAHPDILVAVTGDGETEMAYDRFRDIVEPKDPARRSWADYSPFAVAEFRDWLRGAGLYAAGQPLAGHAHPQAARYAGDASPAVDTNGDGRTLNRDFGTSFTSWDLRYFPWSLSDGETDGAVATQGFVNRDSGAGRFDAPRPDPARVLEDHGPFWRAWLRFRQEMIHRYNRDFARWITESTDASLGGIPFERWYSAQIPTDFLFGNPPADRGVRGFTSGSAHWTADVWPYGGMGVTGYNVNTAGPGGNGPFARTTVHVAPRVAHRSPRWGLVEWNPGDPWSPDPGIYRDDNAVVLQYRPALLMPFKVNTEHYRVFDSGFVVALRELVAALPAPAQRPRPQQRPVGSLDSPANGATIASGPVPVTGWALDDVGVASVEVFRLCRPDEEAWRPSPCVTVQGRRVVYLGEASRVRGARPDVAQAMATMPDADRAGWGFTWAAEAWTGSVTLLVVVTDREGQALTLGPVTITRPAGDGMPPRRPGAV